MCLKLKTSIIVDVDFKISLLKCLLPFSFNIKKDWSSALKYFEIETSLLLKSFVRADVAY